MSRLAVTQMSIEAMQLYHPASLTCSSELRTTRRGLPAGNALVPLAWRHLARIKPAGCIWLLRIVSVRRRTAIPAAFDGISVNGYGTNPMTVLDRFTVALELAWSSWSLHEITGGMLKRAHGSQEGTKMTQRGARIVVLALLGWFLVTEALAQGGPGPTPPAPAAPSDATLLRSQFLFTYRVKSPQGEDLGKIEEIMIDMEQGRVVYAVLSFGGFLGIGNKWVPVPWDALALHPDQKEIVLNIEKEKIQKAPNFEPATLPDLANRQWGAVIHTYYGYPPYWEKRP